MLKIYIDNKDKEILYRGITYDYTAFSYDTYKTFTIWSGDNTQRIDLTQHYFDIYLNGELRWSKAHIKKRGYNHRVKRINAQGEEVIYNYR